jgi:creatinine amidohydrolase
MKLQLMTWPEVEDYLARSTGIVLPVGSTEQHGPMGLIGTDALCAEEIAERAADQAGAIAAPTIAYTPAPFNMAFPGTVSVSEPLFEALVAEIVEGLGSQGFRHIYIVNGHGANLAPLHRVSERLQGPGLRIRSWWDFEPVNALRRAYYGDWEGMHATPSEVAITQATSRRVAVPDAAKTPPRKLSAEFIKAHSGDRHGPPDQHRAAFPDGRVGSHSALATPEQGRELLDAAVAAVADDYLAFAKSDPPGKR